ncbi:hypothetical protein SAMN05519103_08856 [Rhizobiales bacterium GAS113]|nr:hypothetical protein SAMN05519103_08856 [Rhizobiales bacterium GAS113]
MTTGKNQIGERIVTGLSESFIAAGFVVGGVKDAAVEMHHPALSIYACDVRTPTTARRIPVRELGRKNTLALAASWTQPLASREKRRPVHEPQIDANRRPVEVVSLVPAFGHM